MQVRQKVSIPVLTYHSIDESNSVISTKPGTFRRQMKFLHENNYRAVSLNGLVNDLNAGKAPPPKTVALTFDDGFRNFFTRAFPILQEYGFGATVFLVTGRCGKNNDWPGNPPGLPRSELLDWREIRELSDNGIDFGSHTRSHPDLTRCSPKELVPEISGSKKELQDRVGKEVATFAYPYGSFNEAVKQMVAENFKGACSTSLGKVHNGSDIFALERLDTYYLTRSGIFERLSTGHFDRYISLRRILRGFRSFVSTN
jgi:peptidoglycan/xylan/chitin deacetylase (PgdA/CDA1 family)